MRSSFYGLRWSTSRSPNPTIRLDKLGNSHFRRNTPSFYKRWKPRSQASCRISVLSYELV